MKKFLFTLLFVLSPASFANSNEPSSVPDENIKIKQFIMHQQQVNWIAAPAKNKHQLQNIADSGNSALSLLTSDAAQRFIDSVEFRDNGVAGFYFYDLETQLSVKQIYSVLVLIGAQHYISSLTNARVENEEDTILLLGGLYRPLIDYRDFKCESRGTCVRDSNYICTTNC